VSESWMLFAILHKVIVGFSVVCVITGVFIQETFKTATTDDSIMMMQKKRALRIHTGKMEALFRHADHDSTGSLHKEQFSQLLRDPGVKHWLSSMDLDVSDVDSVFTLLDDGDGLLTAEELVSGVARLKGFARSIDVNVMMLELQQQRRALGEVRAALLKRGTWVDAPSSKLSRTDWRTPLAEMKLEDSPKMALHAGNQIEPRYYQVREEFSANNDSRGSDQSWDIEGREVSEPPASLLSSHDPGPLLCL